MKEKVTFDEVYDFVRENKYQSRKDRYVAARDFFRLKYGIVLDEQDFKNFDTFHRYYRDNKIFKKDAVGELKEKDYHYPDFLRVVGNQISIKF